MERELMQIVVEGCNYYYNVINLAILGLNLFLIYKTICFTNKNISRQTLLGLFDKRMDVYNVAIDYIRCKCEMLKSVVQDNQNACDIRKQYLILIMSPTEKIEGSILYLIACGHIDARDKNDFNVKQYQTQEMRRAFANEFLRLRSKIESDRKILKCSKFLFDDIIFQLLEEFMDAYTNLFICSYAHDFTNDENLKVVTAYDRLLKSLYKIENDDLLGKMQTFLRAKE